MGGVVVKVSIIFFVFGSFTFFAQFKVSILISFVNHSDFPSNYAGFLGVPDLLFFLVVGVCRRIIAG